MWIYKETGGFIHKIDKQDGIKIDLFEISLSILERFINGREAPAVNSLLEGKILYNKDVDFDKYILMAAEVKKRKFIPIETMPEKRVKNVLIQLSNLVDDAKDLVNDKLRFRLVFSEVIVSVYNYLYDFFGIWRGTPKNTLRIFKEGLPEIYPWFYTMIDDTAEPIAQVESAEKLVNIMADKYGGIPDTHIITEISE